ncbi:S1 family peptidase [Nocardia sp. NPDC020380]|uniref:S1 family peptidase n=1 Tax=Nocardia sp. NPDC020380 TaxID=3364309 RepID=UPI003799591A
MTITRIVGTVSFGLMAATVAPGMAAAQADPAPAVLGGSSGIQLGEDTLCSLTAIGHDRAGRLVGLTAGHCASAGTDVFAEKSPATGVLGTVTTSVHTRQTDYAVIEFDPSKVTPTRTVGGTTITGVGGPPSPGAVVCANGRSSGFDCGIVWGTPDTFTLSQACSKPGDSGGPVTAGDQLVGINGGRYTKLSGIDVNAPCDIAANPIHSPEYFQPIAPVLAALDAAGGPGAGFTPV